MPRPPRVNYDQIAPLYDSQPYRSRAVDPQFLVYRRDRGTKTPLAVLDIACGTGNQLIANRAAAMDARMVGVDRSLGMLRQARAKAPEIAWVQADSAALPFPARSFDFVGCQFAFHHFPDKAGMLHEVFRALRPGGRFVLRNLCPEESNDWLYYRYFPEALVVDLLDFWPADAIAAAIADVPGRHQLRVGIERDPSPQVARVLGRGLRRHLMPDDKHKRSFMWTKAEKPSGILAPCQQTFAV